MSQRRLRSPSTHILLTTPVLFAGLLWIGHGCQQVYPLTVRMTAEGLIFTSTIIEQGLKENKRYLLLNFGVTKIEPCDKPGGCGMWIIVRPYNLDNPDATMSLRPPNLLSLPIRYGQSFPNMEVTEGPVPLTPGRYDVSAGVSGSSDGIRFDFGLTFMHEFVIKKNAQGNLEVEAVRN